MKFCVLIMDGAAGWPLTEHGNKTCLEIARTPFLDRMAAEGYLGVARTVPAGMEPSSAIACMSVLGYDPARYYRGRSAIEARSMNVPINKGEVVFRCNLVTVQDQRMLSYSAGDVSTAEARRIIDSLNQELGSDTVSFFPGVNYRHICKLKNREETLKAICTPPHDISGKTIEGHLPRGEGSGILCGLMQKSEEVVKDHPVNKERIKAGKLPVTGIWLFWSSGEIPQMPSFETEYGARAAMTSGVDLLKGLAIMSGMTLLEIKGVTDGLDNDYVAQAEGALNWLKDNDMAVVHIEAPDEMGHHGSVEKKVEAIELIDSEVVSRLYRQTADNLRVLIMPDHPTPIRIKTHCDEPVPFLIWGKGIKANGGGRFTEEQAKNTGVIIDPGYELMRRFIQN